VTRRLCREGRDPHHAQPLHPAPGQVPRRIEMFKYLPTALDLFSAEMEVVFASHHCHTGTTSTVASSLPASATSSASSTARRCRWKPGDDAR
jgi:hypothetical protein